MGKKSRRVRNKTGGIRRGSSGSSSNNQTLFRRVLYARPGQSFRIRVDFDGSKNEAIYYSYGNVLGKPEFVIFGVPSNKDYDVVNMVSYYATQEENPENGQTIWFQGQHNHTGILYFVAKLIGEGSHKDELLNRLGISTDGIINPLFELVPQFQNKDRPEYWGRIKAAPENHADLVNSIVEAWVWHSGLRTTIVGARSLDLLFLFLDGNKLNDTPENRKRIDLSTALKHVDDWIVNWDDHLTSEQAAFVRMHNRYFSKVAKVLFRSPKKCNHCGLVDRDKLVRCKCKQRWYCCPECQILDWTEHKKHCKKWRTYFDNEPVHSCAQCGRLDNKLLRVCSRCQHSWYCCEEHQKAHWTIHRKVCEQKILIID